MNGEPSSCGMRFSIHWLIKGCESNSLLGTKIVNHWELLSRTNVVPKPTSFGSVWSNVKDIEYVFL